MVIALRVVCGVCWVCMGVIVRMWHGYRCGMSGVFVNKVVLGVGDTCDKYECGL